MARRRAAIDRFYLWRRIPGPAALIQLPVNPGLTGYFETRPKGDSAEASHAPDGVLGQLIYS
jgi:hypothetical protein